MHEYLLLDPAASAEELGVQFYFARPYHSWERGANENTNGLIRQYIPKGTDFSTLTDEYIAEVEWKLNNRPEKITRIPDTAGAFQNNV